MLVMHDTCVAIAETLRRLKPRTLNARLTRCERCETQEVSVMASKTAKGMHAAVSSEDGEKAGPIKKAQQQPGLGAGGKQVNGGANGAESVPGYKPRTESMPAAELKAPDTSGLKDVGVASFGEPPGIETVIGPDDRIQINPASNYPWRVHCSLLITAADNSQWIGTGWFIGPRTVMTAGHCVFIKNSGVPGRDGWARSIQVMPGRSGKALPYGSITSSNLRSVLGWTRDGNHEYDYGAIILPTDLGNQTGWFGFGVYGDADLLSATANISGYPGDKPTGTQWYHARRITQVGARKVYYDVDTFGGQSGSAVYRIINGARYGVAIHAYGTGGGAFNSGTRITSPVFNNMLAWKG
jgi:glutamyl endopeptidase